MAVRHEAEVRLHGRRVGVLTYMDGGSSFSYEDDLTSADHRPLGQIFEDDPGKIRIARVGVPPWFANLLPEGELRKQVVREMGDVNVGDFTLLLRLGANLPGAVTIYSAEEPVDDVTDEGNDLASPDHPIRHSLAGIQLKYSVHGDRLTFPASGDKAWWIAKLPDRSLKDLCLNEYLTMRWLRESGMNVPEVQLVPASAVGGIPEGLVDPADLVYLIKRFDRSPTGRVHVEDFAQVADVPPIFKYDQNGVTYDTLAEAILSFAGGAGYVEYIERLVAILVIGNIDGHLKNWAVIYSDGRTPSLAPVYDFHCLTIYGRYRYSPLAFSLGGESMSASVYMDNFRQLAENVGLDPERTVQIVRNAVARMRDAWSGDVKAEANARYQELAAHFMARLNTLPICTD